MVPPVLWIADPSVDERNLGKRNPTYGLKQRAAFLEGLLGSKQVLNKLRPTLGDLESRPLSTY